MHVACRVVCVKVRSDGTNESNSLEDNFHEEAIEKRETHKVSSVEEGL